MFRTHPARVVLCTFVAVAGLGLLQPPAHAVIQGKALAGHGFPSCGLTVSCSAFDYRNCDMTANDIDASVRAVNLPSYVITYSAATSIDSVNVQPFDSACNQVGLPMALQSGHKFILPFGTQYVAVWPRSPFAQFTFQLS
jgi:hypothetical protein